MVSILVMGGVGLWLSAILGPYIKNAISWVDGIISPLVNVLSGLPHGTVFGPKLFLVHIIGIGLDLFQGTSASSFLGDTRVLRWVSLGLWTDAI